MRSRDFYSQSHAGAISVTIYDVISLCYCSHRLFKYISHEIIKRRGEAQLSVMPFRLNYCHLHRSSRVSLPDDDVHDQAIAQQSHHEDERVDGGDDGDDGRQGVLLPGFVAGAGAGVAAPRRSIAGSLRPRLERTGALHLPNASKLLAGKRAHGYARPVRGKLWRRRAKGREAHTGHRRARRSHDETRERASALSDRARFAPSIRYTCP